jgi:hypothetical protein
MLRDRLQSTQTFLLRNIAKTSISPNVGSKLQIDYKKSSTHQKGKITDLINK